MFPRGSFEKRNFSRRHVVHVAAPIAKGCKKETESIVDIDVDEARKTWTLYIGATNQRDRNQWKKQSHGG